MHLPILEIASGSILKQFEKLGGCFVPIPQTIQNGLEQIKAAGDIFFALSEAVKKEELKTPDNVQGYINQLSLGYDIERYVFHGLEPKSPAMKDIACTMSAVRDYLQNQVLRYCLKAIMSDLGVSQEAYASHVAAADNTLTIIHYPAQDAKPDRLPAHADAALLTVLWAPQPGLQALINDQWQSVETPPGYVIVQIGDGLKEWTNELVQPLMHRVIVAPNKPRTSIASFATLKMDTPFHNLITGAYIADTFGEYVKNHLKGTYKPR